MTSYRRLLVVATLTSAAGFPGGGTVRAQEDTRVRFDAKAAGFAVSPPARELPAAQPEEKDTLSFRRNSEFELEDAEDFRTPADVTPDSDGALSLPALDAPDPVFEGGPLASFDTMSNADNFAAFGFRLSPPDTNIGVGPHHVVETVNLIVRVYDKAGAPLTPAFKMSSLFTALGGLCASTDDGDPIVLHDPLADRWLISQFAFAGSATPPYHECIAISKTGDPSGQYFLYDFVMPGTNFNDYPHFGVWPDGYYMTDNQFLTGGPFAGGGVFAFDRLRMLAGSPAAGFVYFNTAKLFPGQGIGGMLPADLDGVNPPAPGAPAPFAYFTANEFNDPGDALRIFEFHADFDTPSNSTFTERPESPVAVAPFNPLSPAGRADILQPGPALAAHALDSISDRLLHRLQYRHGHGYESLVVNHTVNVTGGTTAATYRAGVRYYELRRVRGGPWTVQEQATFSPDTDSRWMGSAATDNAGNLAVGYSVSGLGTFPSIRYAGRLATDPPGGLAQGERTLVAGSGVQRSTGSRWGDYSMLAVDPADDCTFWYATEYYTASSQAASTVGWRTRIGSFKFGTCLPPARGTLQGPVTACATGLPIAGALVSTDNGYVATTAASGEYSLSLAPGTYTVVVSASGEAPASAFGVTVAADHTTTQHFCLNLAPDLRFDSFAISGGNGNGVVEFDECNKVTVSVTNAGGTAATGVSAVLTTSTPGVTVTQSSSPHPDLVPGATAGNLVPFEVSTPPTFVCGTPLHLTLNLTFAGGADAVDFTVPTCTAESMVITGSLTAADPQQNLRLTRDGGIGSCVSPKLGCPGVTGTGTRSYDAYTFTNPAASACVTFDLTSGCGLNIFGAAYLGPFNPADICQNYAADQGLSFAGTGSTSLMVPAGQTFTVVVNEVTQGAGCARYTARVSGLFGGSDGGGECVPRTATVTVPRTPRE